MFIIIGKIGERENEEAPKRCSGRMEENSEGVLFEQFKGAHCQEFQILQRRMKTKKRPLVFL